jgi:hypothetical protein
MASVVARQAKSSFAENWESHARCISLRGRAWGAGAEAPLQINHLMSRNRKTLRGDSVFELKRVDLLRWGDIYGLKVYTSILSANFETGARKEKGDPKEARWVYNFKKFGKCADEVRLMVSVLAAHLGCLDIVAVPGSGTEANQLQKLFGTKIERIKEVQTRKNRHKEPLPDDYEDSYVIHTEEIRGEKILVVDDITTTGTTLNHFADSLGKIGYEVIKAAIGLDYKLDIQEGEPLYVYIEPAKTRKSFGTIDVGVRYGPPCKICSHPQAQEFNRGLILSLPGKEGTIRGYSGVTLLIVDEAARVSDDLYYSIRPMLAVSGGRLMALSTPFGKRGWFWEEWRGNGDWLRIKVTAEECPRISKEFLEEERQHLGTWWFNQEYLCEFLDSQTAVFRLEDIEKMFGEEVEKWQL